MTKALTMCMIFMKSSHEMEKVPEAELLSSNCCISIELIRLFREAMLEVKLA